MTLEHSVVTYVNDGGALMDVCGGKKVYLVTLPVGLSFCAPHKKLWCISMCHNHRRVLWTLSDLIHLKSQVCV